MWWGKSTVLCLGLTVLAACSEDTRLDPLHEGPGLSRDTVVLQDGVDQLLVGHRLMEAGEPDLALRAYTRAAVTHGMTAEILSSLGSANLYLGRLGQAERQLRQATEDEPDYVPAWNNLGVVLMERGEFGEARRVFQHAFALDSGQSDSIRENLRLAIARTENPGYSPEYIENGTGLERLGGGRYLLLTP